jgi:malonate transporter
MIDVLNLALPYFGLIFIGFACGRAKGLPETGLAWMNFFLLYVSLPALLFGIMSKTPFEELNNPPFLVATTLGTMSAFALALLSGRIIGRLSFREATLAGLSGGYGNIGYMGPGLALAVLGAKAAAPTALIFCCDSIFLFSIVPLLIALTDGKHRPLLHTLGVVVRQIVLNPLIMSACAGALAAALHIHPPVAIDNTLMFLQNAAAPVALFALGVTVALRPIGRVPWEVPGVIAVKLLIHPLVVFGLMLLLGPFAQPWAATAVLMASLPPALNVFVSLDKTTHGSSPRRSPC